MTLLEISIDSSRIEAQTEKLMALAKRAQMWRIERLDALHAGKPKLLEFANAAGAESFNLDNAYGGDTPIGEQYTADSCMLVSAHMVLKTAPKNAALKAKRLRELFTAITGWGCDIHVYQFKGAAVKFQIRVTPAKQ
jgi:hypothetical protein